MVKSEGNVIIGRILSSFSNDLVEKDVILCSIKDEIL